ncbi:MAG: DVU0298 family protein [Thermodesulfobacteriota bacterium]
MSRPRGRKIRQQVGEILNHPDRQTALERLARIPDNQLKGHLFSHFYSPDALIRFRSVTAMGHLGHRMAETRMENGRDLMRRLMWNLNDESGGIGWGSAEAMGEILSRHSGLAAEFDSILFSFLDPRANYIDNPDLQQGILWGIGTYAGTAFEQITDDRAELISPFLDDNDPVKRAYAVRALAHAGRLNPNQVSENLKTDDTDIRLYTGWQFETLRICDLVSVCTSETTAIKHRKDG